MPASPSLLPETPTRHACQNANLHRTRATLTDGRGQQLGGANGLLSRDDQPRMDRCDGIEAVTNCAARTGSPTRRTEWSHGGPTVHLCAAMASQQGLHELIGRNDETACTSSHAGVLMTASFKRWRPCWNSKANSPINPPRKENILAPSRNQPSGNNLLGGPARQR
jgi:hypothetical protein